MVSTVLCIMESCILNFLMARVKFFIFEDVLGFILLNYTVFLLIYFFIQYSGDHTLRNNVVNCQLNKDPHQIEAKGAFAARVGKSSMSCSSGLDIHPHLLVPVPATGINIQ